MRPLPEWLYIRYAKLYDRYGEEAWTLHDAISTWHDPVARANVVVSMLRSRGHAILFRREGQFRLYRLVNPEDFLFSSIHLPNLDQVQVEAYKPIIIKTIKNLKSSLGPKLVAVGLFGSVARGTPSRTSDVDLYVVADWKNLRLSQRIEEIIPYMNPLDDELSRMYRNGFMTQVAPRPANKIDAGRFQPLHLDFSTDGIIIYDPETFLENTWKHLKTWLTKNNIQRFETEDGYWYWRLDPNIEIGARY
jgi:predicted nucleotidyltransferase